jgi:hypothetical protein
LRYLLANFFFYSILLNLFAQHPSNNLEKFGLDGKESIVRTKHFGIANGNLTIGVNSKELLSIQGIWAPPFVSSDFSLKAYFDEKKVKTQNSRWYPFFIDRYTTKKKIRFETRTFLIPDTRGFVIRISIKNLSNRKKELKTRFSINGTLNYLTGNRDWGFGTPRSSGSITILHRPRHLQLKNGDNSIILSLSDEFTWNSGDKSFSGTLAIPPNSEKNINLTIIIGKDSDPVLLDRSLVENTDDLLFNSLNKFDDKVKNILNKLPGFESDNKALQNFYYKSLIPFLMNQWDVPEFKLHPYYSTGSIKGGCLGSYLWNFGECWEILPFVDPVGAKNHIKEFLSAEVTSGFGFLPLYGNPLEPSYFYPINQEKIIGLIYNYVKITGDHSFLKDTVAHKSILEHVIAQALFKDDSSKDVALINYGPSKSHLELKNRKHNYNYIMPDLNGRRYMNYIRAAELCSISGVNSEFLKNRSESLKTLFNNTLWDSNKNWFYYVNPDTLQEHRYTIQMFYLIGNNLLSQQQEMGLISHLNKKEFLSKYGIHSLSKKDKAYDRKDVDNGGPGSCTAFPLNIAKTFYNNGYKTQAEEILKRILWWERKMPYWGDSFYARKMDYRKNTPLQATLDAVTGAQCIIFGMFGIRCEFDGSIRINPTLPTFANDISLRGIRLKGKVFDVIVKGKEYCVILGNKKVQERIGKEIQIIGDEIYCSII